MALKHHTVIFVPHARASLRKWRVTNLQLGLLFGGIGLATLASLLISWSYFTTSIDRSHLEALRTENQDLRQVNKSFASSIEGLEGKLAEYEERTRKLAILAGLETASNGSEAGIGGSPDDSHRAEEGPQGEIAFISDRLGALDSTLSEVRSRLDARAQWISSMPTTAPVRGLWTSAFGVRSDPVHGGRAFHEGIDISAAPGAPVRATAAGIVTTAGWSGGLGRSVSVTHGYGLNTRYGHLSEVAVREGQRVRRGDVIGYVGNTGRSTGYHLHYEVRQNGEPVNPVGFILEKNTSWR